MKGYTVPYGYMGFIPSLNKYLLFASESEYIDYVTNKGKENYYVHKF